MSVEYGAVYRVERLISEEKCHFVFPNRSEFFYFNGHAYGKNMITETLGKKWNPDAHSSSWELYLHKEYT